MKYVITGGAGFVGSHLCESLLNNRHNVICIDNFYNSKYTNIHNALQNYNYKFVDKDVNSNIEEFIDFSDIDGIIHLAANIHVDKSVLYPKLTYKTNLMSTLNLLEIVRKYDINKFILASSSEVYGSAQYKPIDENHPLTSPHPYGASKIAADRLCNSYIETYGLNVCISRCFNMYGPRQKCKILGSFIPMTINKVLKGRSPIIYGNGKQSRDYLHVYDGVGGYIKLLNTSKQGTFNFGTGEEYTILDITKKIINKCNPKLDITFKDGRSSEVLSLIANYNKANKELGWKPKINFEDGLDTTIEWYRRN